MSGRAMDLAVYERRDGFPCGYLVPTEMVSGEVLNVLRRDEEVDRMSARKRLGDAELAAEVWCSREDEVGCLLVLAGLDVGTEDRARARQTWHKASGYVHTLERFATLPHYDEGEA